MKKGPGQRGILGIRLRVHYTCAVAFVLMAAFVSTQLTESSSFWQRAVLGTVTAALFLLLLIVREFVINLAAGRGRVPVEEVTLFAFGGVRRAAEDLPLPNHELLMAAARLLSTLATAAMLYGIYALSVNAGSLTIAAVAEWLAFIWFSLFLLHFLPGFPLDAGMALRALLLKQSGNYHRATYAASTAGWVAGLLFIFGGVLTFILTLQWPVALAITATGWCLQSASAVIRRQAVLVMSLEPTMVRDVMTGEYTAVDVNTTVSRLFQEHVLVSGWRCFVVTDSGMVKGFFTARNAGSLAWRRWNRTRIGDIMTPFAETAAARPGQSGASALQEMDLLGVPDMPVLENGKVVGVINRERLARLGKLRAEFSV